MNVVLDDWQEEILACEEKRIILCKGRQIGGTTIMARKCAERMISQKGCKIVVASITEDQAELVIAMVLNVLEEKEQKFKFPFSKNIKKGELTLETGSSIISRPVGDTGNAVRGFTGHVLYLNEASRMPEFVFEAAKAILLTTGGDIWIDSTPFGTGTFFHKSFLNTKRFKIFYHTSEEVMKNRPISESWTETQRKEAIEMLKEEKEDMTKMQYDQEYLGLFVGGIQRFLEDELIDKILSINPKEPYIPIGNKFQGIDLARMGGDEIVLISGDKINNEKLKMFDMEIPEGQTLTNTARLILHKDRIINHKGINLDPGGLGWGVYDILHENPQTKDKAVPLDNASKSEKEKKTKMGMGGRRITVNEPTSSNLLGEEMSINLKTLMEREMIELWNDPKIRQSLSSMQYDLEGGKLHIYGNYNHIFEALKRLAWCMTKKDRKLWIDFG